MSAQSCLAGLFPPKYDDMWHSTIEWQPIPVHTTNLHDDYVLASEKRCDHFDYIMLEYMNTTEYKSLFKNYRNQLKHLREMSGKKLETLTDICNLYDTLFIEQLKGKW